MKLSLWTIVVTILISDGVAENVTSFLTNTTYRKNNIIEGNKTNSNPTYTLQFLKYPNYLWFISGFLAGVGGVSLIFLMHLCQIRWYIWTALRFLRRICFGDAANIYTFPDERNAIPNYGHALRERVLDVSNAVHRVRSVLFSYCNVYLF
ncbi:PREDICTED: uncharacterized protein LOC105565333 [Vollenhovia emeryi]|uniref:uncharacterized protein LOC105565333 n=1 Tax=Vollenhovia emeryi TaxID=411798 RepID=UPI0005F5315F|nr:PREDICTED: uncharacterized protein LOC105565333 [Vollenhovia emeryi]